MRKTDTTAPKHFRRHAVAAAIVLVGAGNVGAFEIDTGNPDLSLRFDNTIRYNLGVRTDSKDLRILNAGGTQVGIVDESDNRFNVGSLVTNRVDLLSELDLSYGRSFGARATGAAWYDNAYDDIKTRPYGSFTSAYNNGQLNSEARRYVNGPSGELLDAFVWGNFNVGSVPMNVKVGRHTNYWGEGLLFGTHAISYSQAPSDGVKAVTSPGIETKEVFLPIGQVSAKAQLTGSLSVAAQYFYEWKPTRAPFGGTYFGSADFLRADRYNQLSGSPLNAPRRTSDEPNNAGNWGVNVRYNLEAIESTLGAYYRVFDDYNPVPAIGAHNPASPGAFTYSLTYPRDVRILGLSFARVIESVSVGAEVSYRKNGALNAKSADAVTDVGPRGNTWHAVINGVKLLPSTPVFDTGSLAVEVAYNRLGNVTKNPNLYNGFATGGQGCGTTRGKDDGCSTKDWVGIAVNFTPQYLQVFPSTDLDVPFTVNYGIHGNAPTASGGSEGALAYSAGVRLTYASKHEFTLRYADTYSKAHYVNGVVVDGPSGWQTTDRGWVAFTYKVGF